MSLNNKKSLVTHLFSQPTSFNRKNPLKKSLNFFSQPPSHFFPACQVAAASANLNQIWYFLLWWTDWYLLICLFISLFVALWVVVASGQWTMETTNLWVVIVVVLKEGVCNGSEFISMDFVLAWNLRFVFLCGPRLM